MTNQVFMVGRLNETPKLKEGSTVLQVVVPRTYKNVDGIYETDTFNVETFNSIATNTCEYCKKGDLVGVKGRLQMEENQLKIIAEKITFLSSRASEIEKQIEQ